MYVCVDIVHCATTVVKIIEGRVVVINGLTMKNSVTDFWVVADVCNSCNRGCSYLENVRYSFGYGLKAGASGGTGGNMVSRIDQA